jgi:Cys-tRNA synthase (O-phospho-L-seryl-tRNA:Cys-tRNA synthase)
MIWYAETAPIGIKNMAKKWAEILVVDTTMTFPMTEMNMRRIIWMLRSPVRPEV